MLLRIPIADLYAAPGFLDPTGEAPPAMSDAHISALYSFLPAGTKFELTNDGVNITCPDPDRKRMAEAAELFERASKRAREGDHDKAIQQYERGLSIDVLHTTARRDLAMSRMAKGDTAGADAELRRPVAPGPSRCVGLGDSRQLELQA